MSTGLELARQGLCECCQAKLHHGPYTDLQIAEICEDLGTQVSEFSDWCDDCFVADVGHGDVAYAQNLSDHALQVTKPDYVAQLAGAATQAPTPALGTTSPREEADVLTKRAITTHLRQPGALQPAANLSGPATAGGHDYVVLRNVSGVLAVFRVLLTSRTLKRLKRWPATLNDQPGAAK